MSIADDLLKLDELRNKGVLSAAEFEEAKRKVLAGESSTPASASRSTGLHGFHRSSTDQWIGGVCGGLGKATGWSSMLWRGLLVFLVVASPGSELVASHSGLGRALYALSSFAITMYVVVWLFAPEDDEADKAKAANKT